MSKDRVFDMLDNADDRIVDNLSVPVLPENKKERLYKMSKDKLDRMNNADNDMTGDVYKVEKYKKPRWYGFAATAACVAIVGGLVGGGVLFSRNYSSSDNNNASSGESVISTQPTSEKATGNVELTTSAAENTTEDVTTPAGINDADNVDYSAVAIDLMKTMNAVELASSGCLTLDINRPLTSDSGYFKVTDGNINGYDFSTMAAVKSILNNNFSGDFYDKHRYFVEGSDPLFKEGPDGLYSRPCGRGSIYGWEEYAPEILSSSENKFVARAYYENAGAIFKVDMNIVKSDGKWRVDSTEETLDREVIMGGNAEDQNSTYVKLCKDVVLNKWNDLNTSDENASIFITFNDLDGDGEPEFLFKYGNGEYNYKIDVYAYRNGALKYISDINGSHASFGVDASTKKLVMIYGHMGAGEYDWYTMENDELKQIKTESFEYEYWGSNEQTSRNDILYASVGAASIGFDGTAMSYIQTQSDLQAQSTLGEFTTSNEYSYFTLDIVDQVYSEAVYAARNIPVE